MTELIPFDFDGQPVRTSRPFDSEPWFVVADVCKALGLSNPSAAIARLDGDDLSTTEVIDSMGRRQVANITNESGLYGLIFLSRKTEAKRFKRWVTSVVLPALRKAGKFEIDAPEDYPAALRALASEVEQKQLLAARNAELEPAANSWSQLAEASGDYSLREAAQILDRDPAISTGQNRLSKYLKQIGWTDRTGTPYQSQVDCDRLVLRSRDFFNQALAEQQLTTQLRITVKGLHELHKRMGGSGPLLLAA